MLFVNCTMISSVDLAHYGVSRAKDWVSVNRGTCTRNISYLVYHKYAAELNILYISVGKKQLKTKFNQFKYD